MRAERFLTVSVRSLRTEQCAKSQCVFPVSWEGRGSPRPEWQTVVHSNTGDRRDVPVSAVDFPNQKAEPAFGPAEAISTESLILAQDERWRRA